MHNDKRQRGVRKVGAGNNQFIKRSENWKNNVGSALLEYAQGTGKWDAVETAFVDGWATEYQAAHAE